MTRFRSCLSRIRYEPSMGLYIAELSAYGFVVIMKGDMKFQHESISENDPRMEKVKELFV